MEITPEMKQSRLFADMPDREIEDCLTCSGAALRRYRKDEVIFHQSDEPKLVLVLLDGEVSVCRDSSSGKRTVVAVFRDPGELFGEVYAFLDKKEYEHYSVASSDVVVLAIPKAFLYRSCPKGCPHHATLIRNMLTVLAEKAYTLNQRVQLLSLPSLRHKVAAFLLRRHASLTGLKMNREEMAAYLGVERPSLSRELMRMRDEGLISIDGRRVEPRDLEALRDLL